MVYAALHTAGTTTPGDAVRTLLADKGGIVALNGLPKRPWTRLANTFTAWKGNTSITVEGPVTGWKVRAEAWQVRHTNNSKSTLRATGAPASCTSFQGECGVSASMKHDVAPGVAQRAWCCGARP